MLWVLGDSKTSRFAAQMLRELHRRDIASHASAPIRLDLRQGAHRPIGDGTVTWQFCVGDERIGFPAFGEALRGEESVVVRMLARDGDAYREIRYGRFPYASRYARTIDRIARECAAWIEAELARPCGVAERPAAVPAPIVTKPSLVERVRFLVAEALRFARHAVRFAFEEARWDVAVANTSVDEFLANPDGKWLHWVGRGTQEFLADPFLTSGTGSPRLLCETMHNAQACIVSIDLDDRFGQRTPIVVGDGPASYPHVIDVDGEVWLTPEQHRRKRLEAYRLDGAQTQSVGVMLDGIAAVDPTLLRYDGRWWLFCTDKAGGAANYALSIYWADDPRGPWNAHARNPVKIDIGGARPAGNFFLRDGALHRPAQDCTGRYGSAIVIHRILVLTPDRFEETCVERVDVSALRRKGAVGVHTLSHGHGWVAVDAQFARWSLLKPFQILRGAFA